MVQKWKTDASLHSCETVENDGQINKKLNYETTYKDEFLEADKIKDWPSIGRCIELWEWFGGKSWFRKHLDNIIRVLDVGTKDGAFTEYLNKQKLTECIGVEYSDKYVKYAKSKGRNIQKGDVCNLHFYDNLFDVVFSHHVLGLVSNYKKALLEMIRVTKVGGYMVTLNSIPGNRRKHYSYIDNKDIIDRWLKSPDFSNCKVVFFDYKPYGKNHQNEFIIILQKTEAGNVPKY